MLKKRLNLFSSQKEALSKLEDMLLRHSAQNTLILSGESGSGKSTAVQEFLSSFRGPVRGYTTVRHRSSGKNTVAFQHILLPVSAAPDELTLEYPDQLPADLVYFLYRDENKVDFDRSAFLRLAEYMSPEQTYQYEAPELMLWDEVGGEELLIDSFFETLFYWLVQDDKPSQIIVWKKQRLR
ncbi:MAG: ATP-binding protein, partial [Clostridiaceae bacterium]|nr:ATP-binding protein [Clostridiaceae bacterium]